jgi:DNA-binding helix-hairpin-helix protein with protein kinase domain
MTWPDGSDVRLHDLRLGGELGTGGQGKVHALLGEGDGYVYKEYIASGVNGAALKRLVELPAEMSQTDRGALLRQAAWPLARVVDGAAVKGFIMRKVPQEFYGRTASKPRLREVQYLLYEPKAMWGDIAPPGAEGRLGIARNIVALFRLLHARRLVVGDVSMNNLLWSPAGAVFLLDCDGIRETGAKPVLQQPFTPDWDDPQQPSTGPDLDTDRYKLAMLVARILTRTSALRPGDPVRFVDGVPERIAGEVSARFADAAGPRGVRPDAAHWARALDERGVIELGPLPPVRKPPSLPQAPLDGRRGERPVIHLPPA